MFPERSFEPLSMAARVVNLSTGGAMVTLQQGPLNEPLEALRNCYFELRIALPDTPALFGRVARTAAAEGQPVLGLRFHRAYPELVRQLVREESGEADARMTLPPPVLAPYSPLSGSPAVRLGGTADAASIEVTTDMGRVIEFPVHDGKFDLRLELPMEGENVFRVVARRGAEISQALTVGVTYLPSARAAVAWRIESTLDESSREVVDIEFSGTGLATGRFLQKTSGYLAGSARTRFHMRAFATHRLGPLALQELRAFAEELREEREVQATEFE